MLVDSIAIAILGWPTSHPPHAHPQSMICSQCQLLRELFNQFMAAEDMPPRRLEEMLLLGDDPALRKYYSFLCSGSTLHGPIALAVVDPAVVAVDFDHCPPCKWHWAVNMASDLMDHFRQGMGKAKGEQGSRQERQKAKVPPPHTHTLNIYS